MSTESRRGLPTSASRAGRTARPALRAININASAQKVEVDNGISLHYYYRIADNLLRQASIYREEKRIIDLYIILLRFSSLMCETIPSHRDYQALLPKEKAVFRKKLLGVIDELEALKLVVQHQLDEINRGRMHEVDGKDDKTFDSASVRKQQLSSSSTNQQHILSSQELRKQNIAINEVISSEKQLDMQFKKMTLSFPQPKEETLSRHSILGPNGLRGQWTGPISGIRVQYPKNFDLTENQMPGLSMDEAQEPVTSNESNLRGRTSDMEYVLSLNDGSWSVSGEESCSLEGDATKEDLYQLNIRQPSIPPVLAQLQPESHHISPSKVADPRPGPPKLSQEGMANYKTYQNLHLPVQLLEWFLKLAEANTMKNLETCGVLAGLLKNRMFFVTTLIIPKQESTSDSCQTTDEEEIFNIQDERSLFPLGWIHTHPTQTCFMSSIDLHTHYSYQIMLPEAIAIVMAPTDTERKHGIFHLSDPSGVSVIRNCQEHGFHPHEEPADGNPIYEHCSHVFMNPNLKFDVVDLRNK